MLRYLTNNPEQQLVCIELNNLQIVGLLRLLAKLVGWYFTFGSGSETLISES